jgi:hypothetical protein
LFHQGLCIVFDFKCFNVYAHMFLGPGYGTLRFKVMSNGKNDLSKLLTCLKFQLKFLVLSTHLLHIYQKNLVNIKLAHVLHYYNS